MGLVKKTILWAFELISIGRILEFGIRQSTRAASISDYCSKAGFIERVLEPPAPSFSHFSFRGRGVHLSPTKGLRSCTPGKKQFPCFLAADTQLRLVEKRRALAARSRRARCSRSAIWRTLTTSCARRASASETFARTSTAGSASGF